MITGTDDLIELGRARVADLRRLQAAGLICRSGDFFPSVHYPPITMYPPITEEEMFRGYTVPDDGMFDVYAHLPFCERRCVYCHYPVKLGLQREEKDRYLSAFAREMDLYMARLGIDRFKTRSILVGGGTPTYLDLDQFARFLDLFCRRLDLSACRQFNWDVDPGTMIGPEGRERLRMMREAGSDRLTIGVQSLDDAILRKMNRPHDVRMAIESVENSMEFGYMTNIEFIFGYPGQTIANWIEVMERACGLGVHEIQLYRLKVEAYGDYQGPIKKYIGIRPEEVPPIEETVIMKQAAIEILARHGYHENLRRVFSRRRGDYSVYAHNQCCVLFDQVGFGLTAFSSLRNRFVLNTQSFEEYYRAIDEGRLPLNRGFVRGPEEQIRWAIILPLKNRDVRKKYYRKLTGASLDEIFRPKIEAMKEHGVLVEDDSRIALTPLGGFFADECAQQFQHPQFAPFPRSEYAEGPLSPYVNAEP